MLKIEFNNNYVSDDKKEGIIKVIDNMHISITPNIGDEDYWVFKVQLTEEQALIAFPKFFTYGIGFMKEDDYNTNLPYTCNAVEIYNHIKHNKGNENINVEDCIQAIELLKIACASLR